MSSDHRPRWEDAAPWRHHRRQKNHPLGNDDDDVNDDDSGIIENAGKGAFDDSFPATTSKKKVTTGETT